MGEAPDCIRCHAQMQIGYVPDWGESGYRPQNWYPGEPKKSFWTGLKLKADDLVPVKTFRCPTCGYLESYALPKSASEQ
jgi:hypothetical protein